MTLISLLSRAAQVCAIACLLCSTFWLSSCDDEEEDKLPPEVSFTDLIDGAAVWGVAKITVTATDNGGIDKVEVYVDGTLLTTLTDSPFEAQWDTNALPEGNHTIKVVATDRAGNVAEREVIIAVKNDEFNDTIAPAVEITSPSANATVWSTINVTANITDNRSISKVEFLIDGTAFSSSIATPFSAALNTGTLADGEHTIKVTATDKANNKTEKQVIVTVKNILISISVPSNQLYSQSGWTERGFIFLNDADGKLLASMEFQNGQKIELKAPTFSGETFTLTQVRHSANSTYTDVNFWTYTQVARGKWVLMRELSDDRDYVGEAKLTFSNPAANAYYYAKANGEDEGYVSPFQNDPAQPVRITASPSKLYVRREFESGTPGPAYRLYPSIVVGSNTINLNQPFTQLTKFSLAIPADVSYASISYHGYADNAFREHYELDYAGESSGTLSVYKPEGAFAAYWSQIDIESDSYEYFKTTRSNNPTSYELLSYQGGVNYANNKLTYDVTGNSVDFFSTSYRQETNDLETSWAFVGPKATSGAISIAIPELPESVKNFPRPTISTRPSHFTIYDFEGMTDYTGFLNTIRSSDYGIDQLNSDGKESVDMTIYQTASGGRRAKSKKHHDLISRE